MHGTSIDHRCCCSRAGAASSVGVTSNHFNTFLREFLEFSTHSKKQVKVKQQQHSGYNGFQLRRDFRGCVFTLLLCSCFNFFLGFRLWFEGHTLPSIRELTLFFPRNPPTDDIRADFRIAANFPLFSSADKYRFY